MKDVIFSRAAAGQFVLIAEIGVNYYDIAEKEGISPMEAAKLMVRQAGEAGIPAVKFQTYKAGTLAAKASPSYWDLSEESTTSQYELFKKFDSFGEVEYTQLAAYCEELGIEFLSTPFDIESADYLEPLMNCYKISSSDLSNLPFIEYMAKKGKPMLLSVGASDKEEIDAAVAVIRRVNDRPLALLHCVLEYPTPYDHANLRKIAALKAAYPEALIGYSDHTKPTGNCDVVKTAYTLGAVIIEKHYTLDKTLPGNDHYHGMDPDDARRIIAGVGEIETLLGRGELVCLPTEATARQNARRSAVSACAIPAGTVVTREMLTFKRPGTGIPAAALDKVVGKTAAVAIEEDSILQWEMFAEG